MSQRYGPNGELMVMMDPGGPNDDPEMSRASTTVAASNNGTAWCALGEKLFGLIVQVKDAKPGDTIEALVAVAVADTVPNPAWPESEPQYLPINTKMGGYGVMCAPQPCSSVGWGTREMRFGTSATIPAAAKVGVKYTADSTGAERTVLVDFLRQVDQGG